MIDLEFKPKENVDVVYLNKYLVDGLNLIIENKPGLLEETSEILWLSYIALLKKFYESDNWQKEVISNLDKIDKTTLQSISYAKITKATVKKIEEAI
jgi:hypothetical protein